MRTVYAVFQVKLSGKSKFLGVFDSRESVPIWMIEEHATVIPIQVNVAYENAFHLVE